MCICMYIVLRLFVCKRNPRVSGGDEGGGREEKYPLGPVRLFRIEAPD
jgi:hypothetical protein